MRKMFIFVCLGILMCGCAQHRRWASPEVADVDAGSIVTRNKYRIRSFCTGQKLPLSKTYVSRTAIEAELSRHYPEVFAPDGIPVDIAEGESLDYSNYGVITVLLPFLCSGTTLPLVNLQEWWKLYTITVGDSEFDFKTHFKDDGVGTCLSPIGLCFPFEKNPGIKKTEFTWVDVQTPFTKDLEKTIRTENTKVDSRAIAHGIAVRLKELEDSGAIAIRKLNDKESTQLEPESSVIDSSSPGLDNRNFLVEELSAENRSREVVPQQQNMYRIVNFERESDSSFAYHFVLALRDEENSSLSTLRRIQQEFRKAVKADYMESFSGVNANSLYVDFSEYKLSDGKIHGRAVVLTIAVVALSYDSNTRKGVLAVRVNANQYEEARKWVRKNIETLARDKNIALTTGEIPPAAKFYLGREELKDGNILEVEFRTE